jgi:serine/threonine protein phosphatase PrpC
MNHKYFESVEVSDVGRVRKNNEDACLRIPEKGLYCVADGMGGVLGGDLASRAITTSLQEAFKTCTPGEGDSLSARVALIKKAANQASKWIKDFADEKVIGQMGSTVVALVFGPRNPTPAVGLHAGDSRLYRYRRGELKLLTGDHSAVAALAAKTGRDAASLPAQYQNTLLRAVGLSDCVELEETRVDVFSGDLFLLCSDGLTHILPDDAIAKMLKRAGQQALSVVAQALVDAANEAGGKDNITVLLVKVGDVSGLANVVEPEEGESKTVAVPVCSPAAATPVPGKGPNDYSGAADTDDAYEGHTPQTDNPTPEPTVETPIQRQSGSSDLVLAS